VAYPWLMTTAARRHGWTRSWLAIAAAAGLAASGVAACGDDGDDGAASAPDTSIGTSPDPTEQVLVLHDFEGGLRVIDPETGASEPLDLPIEVAEMAAGPDGTPLVFVEAGTGTIHVLDDLADASSLRSLDARGDGDTTPGPPGGPVVSPDGTQLAAVVSGDGVDQVVVVIDLVTGERTVVVDLADLEPEPTFACEPFSPVWGGPTSWPDLLVVETGVQCEEVVFEATYLMDPSATDPIVEVHQGRVVPSPSGDRFVQLPDTGPAWVEWSDGEVVDISTYPRVMWSSARRLAFLRLRHTDDDAVLDLMVLEPDATDAVEVARGHVTPIGWSPDGSVLVFWSADTGSLWRWDRDLGARDLGLDQGRVVWATRPVGQ
jgi:hypothetical protein